jgi:lipopolysaccharide/colanic/teichoic acid biosynthesis glycosyltransferase
MCYAQKKRWIDLAGAGLGLVLLSPLGALIALAIKLQDRGPVFFGQIRVGQFGRPFRLWKFRSMVPGADRGGPRLTGAGDQRLTRVGRCLRRVKLDELPQFWNVLVGEMSLVGPRPEVPRFVQAYTPDQQEVLRYKPGITDLASVMFRREEALLAHQPDVEQFYLRFCVPRKIQLNQQYGRNATILRDLWIIFRTVFPDWAGVAVLYALSLTASLWVTQQLVPEVGVTSSQGLAVTGLWSWVVVPQLLTLFWTRQCEAAMCSFGAVDLSTMVRALALALVFHLGLAFSIHPRPWAGAGGLCVNALLSLVCLSAARWGACRLLGQAVAPKGKPRPPVRRMAIVGVGALSGDFNSQLGSILRRGKIIAVFDDNPRYWHKRIRGIPVAGMPECLLSPHWLLRLDEIIIALPGEHAERSQRLRELFRGVPLVVDEVAPDPSLALGHLA